MRLGLMPGKRCGGLSPATNDTPKNSIGRDGNVVEMGTAGGVVEDSVLDTQHGGAYVCLISDRPDLISPERTAPLFAAALLVLAIDGSDVARSIYRETRGFS